MFKTLKVILVDYAVSFCALSLFCMLYTAAVFHTYQNQNFALAKKPKAEKLSTDTTAPVREVASPFETE